MRAHPSFDTGEALSETFGRRISGKILSELSDGGATELKELLYRHKVLLFDDVHLTIEEYLSLARRLGQIVTFVEEEYRHPDYPEIFVVSNVKKNGKKFGMDRVGYYWHSDSSYMRTPLPVTMLYCQQAPESGGETAFIDMQAAFESLPGALRDQVTHLNALHEGKWRYLVTQEDVGLSIQELLDRDEKLLPPPVHPLTVVHPATRAKALYLSEGITKKILEVTESEGARLLKTLYEVAFDENRKFVHTWKPRQVILWDNRSVVHRAFPAAAGQSRLMFRIGINDGPFFGQGEARAV